MDRSQKADLVAELKNVFTETSVVVVTRNLGLSVAQSTDLRLKMRDAGAQFKVAKNRLAKIALEGTRYGSIGEMLTGPTALAGPQPARSRSPRDETLAAHIRGNRRDCCHRSGCVRGWGLCAGARAAREKP